MTLTRTMMVITFIAVLGVGVFFAIQWLRSTMSADLTSQMEYQTCVTALMGDDNIKPEDALTRCKEKQDTQAQ